ncbi:pyridoxal phosphate-dependent aminotransferase [Clostridium tetani]|uniref:Aminotransferase n=1 Tax=Clostridium tetani TaxID=1513 RepID=A0ABY0EKU0_CLOTA|nr:pyridoxal phosphate-dependent aminotransferase [Clostridium tetani]CDI49393.1 aspartate aminotransferase [Clostridium tetani 12124569]KHO39388.1 aspartate aminotransferase [Clostridium tetani]RXI37756.1 pyridoxal phosphate-dependent aminotransferase [Clostridium tetani]RXI51753.1 pyridoxal phosphate-dependent aminotransferase [Clostridium tetani]RXI74022.1 pyridoxal phosphate-dependent aminotransferase [Clostridium tetani]
MLSKKGKKISPSVTLAITAKANEMKKDGIDVVGFGAGEPDFNTPENIQNAAIRAMKEGHTKYTPVSGVVELKEAIVNKFKKENNLIYKPSQIIVSTGAKQCIANLFMAILNPGDEVLISTPYWVSYPELVKLADGVPVFVDCKKENDYKYSIDELEKKVSSKTKAIIISSPNNPTGSIYYKEELRDIAEFCKKHNLIILSDEIYEKLIYGHNKHISIASLNEDAYNRTVVINGVSKTYAMTGWRIGYAAGPGNIIKLMNNIQSHMTSNPNSIAQYAALEALTGEQEFINSMVGEFEKRRNYMVEKINSINGIECIEPKGAFYMFADINKVIGKKINGEEIKNSVDFCEKLLELYKVAVVPGVAFGLENHIRLSYAISMENIEKGLERISNCVRELQS